MYHNAFKLLGLTICAFGLFEDQLILNPCGSRLPRHSRAPESLSRAEPRNTLMMIQKP